MLAVSAQVRSIAEALPEFSQAYCTVLEEIEMRDTFSLNDIAPQGFCQPIGQTLAPVAWRPLCFHSFHFPFSSSPSIFFVTVFSTNFVSTTNIGPPFRSA
jgi:hypothetical protein